MKISKELKERIENLFTDVDLKEKLLSLDPDAIRQIGRISQAGMKPEKIIEAYKSNKMNEIYEEAKRMNEAYKIYLELCSLYVQDELNNNKSEDATR